LIILGNNRTLTGPYKIREQISANQHTSLENHDQEIEFIQEFTHFSHHTMTSPSISPFVKLIYKINETPQSTNLGLRSLGSIIHKQVARWYNPYYFM